MNNMQFSMAQHIRGEMCRIQGKNIQRYTCSRSYQSRCHTDHTKVSFRLENLRQGASHSFDSACASRQIPTAAPVPYSLQLLHHQVKNLLRLSGSRLDLLQHSCTVISSCAWPVYPAKYSGCCFRIVVFELSIFCSFLFHLAPWQGVPYFSSFMLGSTGIVACSNGMRVSFAVLCCI